MIEHRNGVRAPAVSDPPLTDDAPWSHLQAVATRAQGSGTDTSIAPIDVTRETIRAMESDAISQVTPVPVDFIFGNDPGRTGSVRPASPAEPRPPPGHDRQVIMERARRWSE